VAILTDIFTNYRTAIFSRSRAGRYVRRVPHASDVLLDQILQRDNSCGVPVSAHNSGEVTA
jgi:hypothetical protein